MKINVPADVPKNMVAEYKKNFKLATHNTGNLMLFAGDQKIEHLNDDFVGKGVHKDDADPEHLFKIADKGTIGVFAAQFGMIARYARDYSKIPYLVKVNSKTPMVDVKQADPISQSLVDFDDILVMKENGINVVGIGYTIYLGSEFEDAMLSEAARFVTWAHQNGMISVLWIYPRGKAVKVEKAPHLIAGATGSALVLGTDFVKVNFPAGKTEKTRANSFKEAVTAAGRTGVITSGGSSRGVKQFLKETYDQIHISGARGNATGRNIHQKSLKDAVAMCNAISSITLGKKDPEFAYQVYLGKKRFKL